MQFIANGPDIPLDLLKSQECERHSTLCGSLIWSALGRSFGHGMQFPILCFDVSCFTPSAEMVLWNPLFCWRR